MKRRQVRLRKISMTRNSLKSNNVTTTTARTRSFRIVIVPLAIAIQSNTAQRSTTMKQWHIEAGERETGAGCWLLNALVMWIKEVEKRKEAALLAINENETETRAEPLFSFLNVFAPHKSCKSCSQVPESLLFEMRLTDWLTRNLFGRPVDDFPFRRQCFPFVDCWTWFCWLLDLNSDGQGLTRVLLCFLRLYTQNCPFWPLEPLSLSLRKHKERR